MKFWLDISDHKTIIKPDFQRYTLSGIWWDKLSNFYLVTCPEYLKCADYSHAALQK